MNKILLVGGVDNSGGAGILADKETLVTLGSGAAVAVTAITVQSDDRFHDSHSVPAVILEKQLNSINLDEIGAIKIGMLPHSDSIEVLAEFLTECRTMPVVLDPVFSSSSGGELCSQNAFESLTSLLLPLVSLTTPNLSEALRLTDSQSEDSQDPVRLANECLSLGARAFWSKEVICRETIAWTFLLGTEKGNCFLRDLESQAAFGFGEQVAVWQPPLPGVCQRRRAFPKP